MCVCVFNMSEVHACVYKHAYVCVCTSACSYVCTVSAQVCRLLHANWHLITILLPISLSSTQNPRWLIVNGLFLSGVGFLFIGPAYFFAVPS